jgi:hypothetical protein
MFPSFEFGLIWIRGMLFRFLLAAAHFWFLASPSLPTDLLLSSPSLRRSMNCAAQTLFSPLPGARFLCWIHFSRRFFGLLFGRHFAS